MKELKRRDFLKMVGLVVVCPAQLLGKSNVLSDSDWQAIHINISQAIKEKSRLFKITSREEAERIAKRNLYSNRLYGGSNEYCFQRGMK